MTKKKATKPAAMRHADRCVFWKRPEDAADVDNSLHDAAVALPAGKMLVYFKGPAGTADAKLLSKAARVAGNLRLALVQWPGGTIQRASNGEATRLWLYAMQRAGA